MRRDNRHGSGGAAGPGRAEAQGRYAGTRMALPLAIFAWACTIAVVVYSIALYEAAQPLHTPATPRGLQSVTLFSSPEKAQAIALDCSKERIVAEPRSAAASATEDSASRLTAFSDFARRSKLTLVEWFMVKVAEWSGAPARPGPGSTVA